MRTSYILSLAAVVLIITAWFSAGFHQSDEHFQLLEFAGLKLGINQPSDLSWEYHQQMRPALQPAMVYLAYQAMHIFGTVDPFHFAFLLRLLSAALFLFTAWKLFLAYRPDFPHPTSRLLLLAGMVFLWFSIYNGVRFSSENWAGCCFALGLVVYKQADNVRSRDYLFAGLLMGAAFVFRYQTALLILGFVGWLVVVRKSGIFPLIYLFIGGLAVSLLGVLVDYWFYGDWVLTSWNYFAQNLIEDKVSNFGQEPWYEYFQEILLKGIPPLSLLYLVLPILFFYRFPRHEITWILLPFLAVHQLIGHKELRFLFPALPFLAIMCVTALDWLREQRNWPVYKARSWQIFYRVFLVINGILLLITMFHRPTSEMGIYRFLHQQYPAATIIYTIGEKSPYDMALEVKFYQPAGGYKRQVITDIAKMRFPNSQCCLLILRKPLTAGAPNFSAELVYTSFPSWASSFNINGWLDRSRWWYVYEVS